MRPEPHGRRIRVLVGVPTGIIPDVLRSCIAAEPDFELVATEGPPAPDVVILRDGIDGDRSATQLLYASPRTKVIVISTDARVAELFEMSPTKRSLGELSPESLVRAVRSATGRS